MKNAYFKNRLLPVCLANKKIYIEMNLSVLEWPDNEVLNPRIFLKNIRCQAINFFVNLENEANNARKIIVRQFFLYCLKKS